MYIGVWKLLMIPLIFQQLTAHLRQAFILRRQFCGSEIFVLRINISGKIPLITNYKRGKQYSVRII